MAGTSSSIFEWGSLKWTSLVGFLVVLVMEVMRKRRQRLLQQQASKEPFHVVIIGAGVTGICSAYYLQKKGIPFTILEKNEQLGGTWLTQRFPGVRFDSSHVQTLFSFAPMMCEPMPEGHTFLNYLLQVAKKYGIYDQIKFSEAVETINFDSKTKKWTVRTVKSKTYQANFVINANGYYDPENPNIPPEFRDHKNFKGRVVHSMKIDQEKEDFTGKTVVLVGSGATAATMVPVVAKTAKSVTMIQRSPSYVMQSDWGQYPGYAMIIWLYERGITVPWKIYRLFWCVLLHEIVMFVVHVLPNKYFRQWHRDQLEKYSKLDKLTIDENFTPSYNFGEQRPLVSLGFIESLSKNVSVITAKTGGLTEDGVVVKDRHAETSKVIPADVVVLATGFNLEYFKFTVSMDHRTIDMYDQVLRRDMWFENIPNFLNMVLFARLDSKNYTCFTPLVEQAIDFVTDLIQDMRAHKQSTVQIKPFMKDKRPTEKYLPMSSGYFARNKNKCFISDPKEASSLGRVSSIVFGYSYHPEDFIFSK